MAWHGMEAAMGSSHVMSQLVQVRKLLDNGVKVGIGVDGTASNDAGHMLMEVRQAMLLQRVTGNEKGGLCTDAPKPSPAAIGAILHLFRLCSEAFVLSFGADWNSSRHTVF